MADPWLTIVGLGEDGIAGLSAQGQAALATAEIIMGPARHLALVPEGTAERITWPVPFADGLEILDGLQGRRVVLLASGDPFWFGAGSVIARRYEADAWRAVPGPSCFSLAAAELGWALETTTCLGLHATPISTLRRSLAPGARLILTLRDGDAVADLTAYLSAQGFGQSAVTILERLGAPQMRLTRGTAGALQGEFEHPLVAAIEVAGKGPALTLATGQADDVFDHDGQITKRPVRAITLSTLAPKPGEHLWDIGGGSGSIALEWLLCHPTTRATSIEPRADRAARIAANADALGLSARITVVDGAAPEALAGCAAPNAIFLGGGLSEDVLDTALSVGVRVVANAVTLEGEALLAQAQATHGGDVMRIALSHSTPLGSKRGWSSAYPVVQWSYVP